MAAPANKTIDSHTVKLFKEPTHDMIGTRTFGFWLYMLSDAIIYAALFSAYVVLDNHYAGGPTAADVLHPVHALFESFLVFSSAGAFGLGMRALARADRAALMRWIGVAFAFGAAFVAFEIHDFHHAVQLGITPQRSGYLSIYFTLVGVHGLHMLIGLIWMLVMVVQIRVKGFTYPVVYRLLILKIFWLFQAVIWVCVFSFIYLQGII